MKDSDKKSKQSFIQELKNLLSETTKRENELKEDNESLNRVINFQDANLNREISEITDSYKEKLIKTRFELENMVKPGVTTLELDSYAENFILDQGAVPAFKGLYGFPGTLCVSINDEVVHGVPSNRELINGDIIGIDVGSIHQGFFGDHAKTFAVGSIDSNKEKLIDVTKECLMKGISQAKPGNRIGDIGYAIQTHAESFGFGVVKDLVGHGIGEELHEEPQIPNYGEAKQGYKLRSGMCIAIEPMINSGSKDIFTASDGWTILTKDGLPSAHFEHTIAITDQGPKVLSVGSDG